MSSFSRGALSHCSSLVANKMNDVRKKPHLGLLARQHLQDNHGAILVLIFLVLMFLDSFWRPSAIRFGSSTS